MSTMSLEKTDYDEDYKKLANDVICPYNDDYLETVRDMIIYYQEKGIFDFDVYMEEIRVINYSIFERIAEMGIERGESYHYWHDDNDYLDYMVLKTDDIADDFFLGQDMIIGTQQMIFESSQKYNLTVRMSTSDMFEHPEFVLMYSDKNSEIEKLYVEDDIHMHSNHSQLGMFDDFIEDGCVFYGKDNILLIDENNCSKSTVKSLEG